MTPPIPFASFTLVKVVTNNALKAFLDHFGDGAALLQSYLESRLLEPGNGTYARLYVNTSDKPSALDPCLPMLREALDLSTSPREFILVYFSW